MVDPAPPHTHTKEKTKRNVTRKLIIMVLCLNTDLQWNNLDISTVYCKEELKPHS